MKLEPGKCSYAMEPFGLIVDVAIASREQDPDGACIMLNEVHLRELIRTREEVRSHGAGSLSGVPAMYAIARTADRIEIWPAPDQAYNLRIRFHPPLKEI